MDNDEPYSTTSVRLQRLPLRFSPKTKRTCTDGIIGPSTLPLLMDANAKHYAAKLGDAGEDVKRIQTVYTSLVTWHLQI